MRNRLFRGWPLWLLLALPLAAQAQSGKKPAKLVAPKTDPDKIYDYVSHPAEPEGGLEAYDQYLNDHLNYPTHALQNKIGGTDSVAFVVEKNGRISNVTLVHGFDPECDAEAVRLIKAAPKWKPGRHRGETVRQRVVVPITFALPSTGGADAALGGTSADVPAPAGGGPKVIQPEKGAQPVGGTDAFFQWIQTQIQYPAAAKRQKLEGKVRVEFMIEPDGSLSNVKPLDHPGGGLEQEAVRIIKSAPKWEPALYQGQAIRQKMVLPVIFQL